MFISLRKSPVINWSTARHVTSNLELRQSMNRTIQPHPLLEKYGMSKEVIIIYLFVFDNVKM